jgi:hypothetical protein
MRTLTYFKWMFFFLSISSLNAQVGIGTTTPHMSSILDVNSTTAGFLPPRLTTLERDAIASPSQGLIIFNTDTQCLEVYNFTEGVWKANCGDQSATTGIFTPDCSGISVQGTYTTGQILVSTTNTITIPVSVTQLGTYSITASSAGMFFTKSGTFTVLGAQNIVLEGSGFPTTIGSNLVTIQMGNTYCNVIINVQNGIATITACPTAGVITGTVATGQTLNTGDMTIPFTNITYTGGSLYGFTTSANNGLSLSSPLQGSLGISPANLTMNVTGTPTFPGNTTLSYSINNQTACTITIPVLTGTGRVNSVTCGGALAGTYTSGTAMTGSNTKVIVLDVSVIGTFNVSTNVVNGVKFVGSYTAVALGVQNMTLTATGTPLTSGTFIYNVNISINAATFSTCTFNVTYALPPSVPNYTPLNCATLGNNYTYIKPSNTTADDWFGGYYINWDYTGNAMQMSADGLTLVVGGVGEDGSGSGINPPDNNLLTQAGAAYVFTRATVGGAWTQQAYLKASNPGYDDVYGTAVAVSDDGNTIVVGAPREDSNAVGVNGNQANDSTGDSGAAYVYTRSGTTWTQQAYLKASNTGAWDWFGFSVAVSGDGNTVAVGAFREDGSNYGINPTDSNGAADSGAIYMFTRSGSTWTPQATIKASNGGGDDRFGFSVALSTDGSTLATGANREDSSTVGINSSPNNSAGDSGATYIFSRTGTTWTQQTYIKAGNTGGSDYFGYSVSLSGDGNKLVVGAPFEDGNGIGVNPTENDLWGDSGAAYVFSRTGTTWSQSAYLKANSQGSDYFGWGVAISKDSNHVLVGAPAEDTSFSCINPVSNNLASDNGAAYSYHNNAGTWGFGYFIKAANSDNSDYFGNCVSINQNGTSMAVTADAEDGSGIGINSAHNNSASASGACYVFTP